MNKFLIPIYLFLPLLLGAQRVTVSEPVSVRDDYYYQVMGDERGNVLLFRDKRTKFEVNGYDGNMQLRWEKELELDKKSPEVLKVLPLGGDFGLVYKFKQKQQTVLKIHRYSPGANLLDSATIKVFDSILFAPNIETTISEDKNIILFWYAEGLGQITAFAFDIAQMKVLWEHVFSPDGIVLQRDFAQVIVDNSGNMYFVLKKNNLNFRRRDHYLEIFEYGPASDGVIQRHVIQMEDYLTFDLRFSFDNQNKALKAAGFYSSDNAARADGYYYFSLDCCATSDYMLRFHPFDEEMVGILLEKEKTRNKGLPEVSIREVVHRTDGGIILIGEMNKEFQRGMTTTSYYSRSGFRPVMDYYYDDLFLISIHNSGEAHWRNVLHKKQYSQDDAAAYSSYFLAKTPTALRVIFNDEIKQGNTVSEYVVRGNGEFTRKAVLSTERKDLSLRFRDAVQVAANEFVVPSEKRNRLKLVRVSY